LPLFHRERGEGENIQRFPCKNKKSFGLPLPLEKWQAQTHEVINGKSPATKFLPFKKILKRRLLLMHINQPLLLKHEPIFGSCYTNQKIASIHASNILQ
jgi:hypothetical protein